MLDAHFWPLFNHREFTDFYDFNYRMTGSENITQCASLIFVIYAVLSPIQNHYGSALCYLWHVTAQWLRKIALMH